MNLQDSVAVAMVFIVGLNFAWTVYWSHKVKQQMADKDVSKAIQNHEARLGKMESKLEAMPSRVASHEDVEKVHTRVGVVRDTVSALGKDVGEMNGWLRGIHESVTALNNYHLGK